MKPRELIVEQLADTLDRRVNFGELLTNKDTHRPIVLVPYVSRRITHIPSRVRVLRCSVFAQRVPLVIAIRGAVVANERVNRLPGLCFGKQNVVFRISADGSRILRER